MSVLSLLVGLFVVVQTKLWAHHDVLVDNVVHETLAAIVGIIFGVGGFVVWRKISTSKPLYKVAYSFATIGLFGLLIFTLTWLHQTEPW